MKIVIQGNIWVLLLFILYFSGAYAAIVLAKINIPFELHRAHSFLDSTQTIHKSRKYLKNKWFIVIPVLIVLVGPSTLLAEVFLLNYQETQKKQAVVEQQQQQKNVIKNREISIQPQDLEHRSSKDILRYAYAYHIGLLFNKRGTYGQPYIVSSYIRDTLLKYLIRVRNNARAKFILALMNKDQSLLTESAEQGDKYAKIYSLVYLMCEEQSQLAKKQLESLKNIYHSNYL